MAQLSQLAYKGKNSKPHFQKLGYTGHKYFDVDGAQCHAVLPQFTPTAAIVHTRFSSKRAGFGLH